MPKVRKGYLSYIDCLLVLWAGESSSSKKIFSQLTYTDFPLLLVLVCKEEYQEFIYIRFLLSSRALCVVLLWRIADIHKVLLRYVFPLRVRPVINRFRLSTIQWQVFRFSMDTVSSICLGL